jgi:tRNA(Ile)-lysidine synthase
VAPRIGLRAGAVLVDHGWSPHSAEVIAAASDTCRSLGLAPVETVRVDCAGPGGPEAAARTARYTALDDVARRHAATAVLLGHTRDDQAETVLLGLARGSGQRSLAGMPARRDRYRRPLLGLPRAVTVAACADLGLPTWTDPANLDPAYRRSRVRALLPALEEALGPGLIAALARTAELAREDADVLDALAVQLLDRATDLTAPTDLTARADPSAGSEPEARSTGSEPEARSAGSEPEARSTVDVAVLAAAPDAVRRRALRLAAVRAGSPAGRLARRHVLAIDALVTRWHGQGRVDLPGGVGVSRRCGRLVLVTAPVVGQRLTGTDPDRE